MVLYLRYPSFHSIYNCSKNSGETWNCNTVAVKDHDFRSEADAIAVPFSIYDLRNNSGFVCVGTSRDTPQFAVESITRWWSREEKQRYPNARGLLILADAGGSNGARCRAWKHGLYKKLCNHYGLKVTVAHYPSGASKWNPVEHRLHSEISKNWAGRPLDSIETILNYINTTTTSTGLKVRVTQADGSIKLENALSTQSIGRYDVKVYDLWAKPYRTNEYLGKLPGNHHRTKGNLEEES